MIVPQKVVDAGGHAHLLDVVRRGTQHAIAIHDAAHAQRRILDDAKAEGKVDAFLEDVDIVVRQAQAHLDVGILLVKIGDAGRDEPAAEAKRRGHADDALGLAGNRGDRRLRILDRLDDAPGAAIEDLAVLGRRQLPGRAVEKPHAEIFLQLLHAVARHRRGYAQIAAGGRQVAEFDDP